MLAQLVEQPRVLDGDDGLRGEVLHQLDLLFGERTDRLAVDADRANQLALFQYWHDDGRASASELRKPCVRVFCQDVIDVKDLLAVDQSASGEAMPKAA